ncbi:MAG: hypothetical protein Tsb0013_25060 [Phycisphaerales bacterium]
MPTVSRNRPIATSPASTAAIAEVNPKKTTKASGRVQSPPVAASTPPTNPASPPSATTTPPATASGRVSGVDDGLF